MNEMKQKITSQLKQGIGVILVRLACERIHKDVEEIETRERFILSITALLISYPGIWSLVLYKDISVRSFQNPQTKNNAGLKGTLQGHSSSISWSDPNNNQQFGWENSCLALMLKFLLFLRGKSLTEI